MRLTNQGVPSASGVRLVSPIMKKVLKPRVNTSYCPGTEVFLSYKNPKANFAYLTGGD